MTERRPPSSPPPRGRDPRHAPKPQDTGVKVRAAAARVVHAVINQGKSLDDALAYAEQRNRFLHRDRALLAAIVYGVLRHYRRLGWQADQLLEKPLKDAPLVDALLRIGLFQMLDLRIPDYAASSATAGAVDLLDAAWARPLINALLRRCQREPERMQPPEDSNILHSWPDWMAAAIARDWGDMAPALLESANQQAPMTLRVNRRRMTAEAYLQRLRAKGLDGRLLPGADDAVVLSEPAGVEQLPGFSRGTVSIQDASAQLAADLLDLQPGLRLLDACAAPGGKTAHALERQPSLQVTALDNDRDRLTRVDETLRRVGVSATLAAADATDTARWWDRKPFDRILIDAPCSGTGVVRRHPDIKWLRRQTDIPNLAGRQRALLDALWPLLAPGGRLVFATCSMLRAEGTLTVESFLGARDDAVTVPITLPAGDADGCGWRIPPGGDWDGFFYAVVHKKAGSAQA